MRSNGIRRVGSISPLPLAGSLRTEGEEKHTILGTDNLSVRGEGSFGALLNPLSTLHFLFSDVQLARLETITKELAVCYARWEPLRHRVR